MSLQIPEVELFELFNLTPDFVCIAGKDGYFKNINQAVIDKLEYSKEELFATPISNFIHPDDQVLTSNRRAELLTGKPLMNFDNRYLTKSGKIIWLHWTSIYIAEREIVFALAKDITEKKKREFQLLDKFNKYKGLTSHFKSALENDKRFMAIELHEEVAQIASVIKMNIDRLSRQIGIKDSMVLKSIEDTVSMTQLLIDSVRNMSYSASPHMIEELGLGETLQWLAHDYQKRYSIPCSIHYSFKEEFIGLIKMDLFRLCQGALEFVMYPEKAQAVDITVKVEPDQEQVTIVIEGSGLRLSENSHEHIPGLRNIRERVASLDGDLVISQQDNNSCIHISFLLNPEINQA